MNGDIIIHTLFIYRAGEQQYFQINVPRDVTAITGIITGIQLTEVPIIGDTGQVGTLQLQATGRANDCYNSIVKLEPAAALKSDLSLTVYQAGFSRPNALLKDGLAQRGRNSPEIIVLPTCNCFYGNYRDILGKSLAKDVKYQVSITFWTTKKIL